MLLSDESEEINKKVKTCLVTGASGFVGSTLMKHEYSHSISLIPVYRKSSKNAVCIKEINKETNWTIALNNIDIVIHAAARVHIMADPHKDPLAEFRAVNVDGTLNLARQAAEKGVQRFIYLSSIKVNGETTNNADAFTECFPSPPEDPYALSKYEAETGLRKIAAETNMEIVIIRSPLVYGANVKANFLNLMKLADTPIPLPFSLINNKRSMVYVGNLVDLIIKCIDHPAAGNQTLIVSDANDLSLKGLLEMLRKALGRPARLFAVPSTWFCLVGRITGKADTIDRLIGDLQVNPAKTLALLEWTPPYSVQQGINAAVVAYSEGKK